MTTRRSALLVSTVAGTLLLATGCSRYEVPIAGGHSGEGHSQQEQAEPTATASPSFTEAPAEQVLEVTLRDVPPLSAYQEVDGACVLVTAGPDTPQLYAGDHATPDEVGEAFDVPSDAMLLDDGTCETSFEVTVARAEMFDLGVAVPGRGIADPSEPTNTAVIASASPQKVTVLR